MSSLFKEQQHGRFANGPGEIPRKGWWDVMNRVRQQMEEDNLNIVAAGVAFYAFLAIFPAIAATISIYGLVVEPQTVEQQLQQLAGILPAQSRDLIGQILRQITGRSGQALGWGVAASILIGFWSANNGTKALFNGINIAYDEKEKRSFFKENTLTLAFTFAGVLLVIISMALIVGLQIVLQSMQLPPALQFVIDFARWPILAVIILISLALLYRVAPIRQRARWRWVSVGSTVATVLWLVGSWAFSFYIANFSNYNATYGSVAAVVILLMWFLLSSYAILVGAEINAESERQTRKDTTIGVEQPMGKRGAYAADTLGKAA